MLEVKGYFYNSTFSVQANHYKEREKDNSKNRGEVKHLNALAFSNNELQRRGETYEILYVAQSHHVVTIC